MKRRKGIPTWLWIGFLIFLLVLVGISTNNSKQETLPRAQWSDASPLGGKGLRLTLQALGYTPKLQRAALISMPPDAKVWLLLDPETRFSVAEAQLLTNWVKKGGLLLFCLRPEGDIFGIPTPGIDSGEQSEGVEKLRNSLGIDRSTGEQPKTGQFLPDLQPLTLDTTSRYRSGVKVASGSARNLEVNAPYFEVAGAPGGVIARRDIGAGHVFALPDALIFTNYALSEADNATFVTNLMRAHVPSGAVYFDERSGGVAARDTSPLTISDYLRRPPVSYAMLQLLAAGLLFWAFAGRRLGAAVLLAPDAKVTRASQFAGAMGALFAKVGRPQAAASILGARFRSRLAQRLGLSPSEADAVLARRAQEVAGIPFESDGPLAASGPRANAIHRAGAARCAGNGTGAAPFGRPRLKFQIEGPFPSPHKREREPGNTA